jgi:hypothetical protein
MSKYGPTRGELKFRLGFSAAGLVLMAVALAMHGVKGIAWLEIVLIAGGFFGGTFVWTLLKLIREEPE